MGEHIYFPKQQLPASKKTKEWRKKHLDWADNISSIKDGPIRKSMWHKKVNYDLLNNIIHMEDLNEVINPFHTDSTYVPVTIKHYPIMNSKLSVLRGEELGRLFEYRTIVTNPNAISEAENRKKEELLQDIQEILMDESQSEEEFNEKMDNLNEYYTYEWQDMHEVMANAILNHYQKENNFNLMFNSGFMDALAVGEEIYKCDIVGGEPIIERVNPCKINILRSGYSNRIEDADVVILEDYWSPGKIIDTYYDVLEKKDREYIESINSSDESTYTDENGNIDERKGFVHVSRINEDLTVDNGELFDPHSYNSGSSPFDDSGNIRVLRMYWKSRRKIKKVKSYNENGEVEYNFRTEHYVTNEDMGEEEEIMYINEAWEGTKIGEKIYVNIRPRPIQYNRLSNPSRCHFGIVGSIYNLNDNRACSLVDMMKNYNYMYDVVHDRLNRMLEKNMGKVITLDLAKKPGTWDVEKWMYFLKTYNISFIDSFNEGQHGNATGKLAGGMNNASSGVIDAELGSSIEQHIKLLENIELSMASVIGMTPQREGSIQNRETVGGVERSVMQSSYVTEWLFATHDDVKKRATECFLETAKIAMKGTSKKFQYILSDNSRQIIDVDGDVFAEADYGLVVDNSRNANELAQQISTLAQAAMQNQTISFSAMLKMFMSTSLAEKARIIERSEKEMIQRNQQQQEQQNQLQQQQMEQQAAIEQAKMQQIDMINQRDNETKLLIANINAESKLADGIGQPDEDMKEDRKLQETIRQFDETMRLNREKLSFEKDKARVDAEIKRESIRKRNTTK